MPSHIVRTHSATKVSSLFRAVEPNEQDGDVKRLIKQRNLNYSINANKSRLTKVSIETNNKPKE